MLLYSTTQMACQCLCILKPYGILQIIILIYYYRYYYFYRMELCLHTLGVRC